MDTIAVNGTTLSYVERGRGEPVVLVHGTIEDHRSWPFQLEPFAEAHRTFSYSRRYHHPNPCSGDETDYSAALHADDLAGFIDRLGLDSAHVVGTSYGAYTGLVLAVRHPERVRSLVAGEPPIFPILDDHPEGRALREDLLREVWEPVGTILQQGRMEDGVRTFVDSVVGEGAFDASPPEIRDLNLDNARELRVETASPDYWAPFTREDAAGIATPTLLLTSDGSPRIFTLVVEELAACMPDAEHVRIPDSSHDLHGSNPGAYNDVVLGFLADHAMSVP